MKYLYENYIIFLWLALALTPAIIFRARRLSGRLSTVAQRSGYFLLTLGVGLAWSNILSFLAGELSLSPVVYVLTFGASSLLAGLLIGPMCYGILRGIERLADSSFFSQNAMFFGLTGIWVICMLTGSRVAEAPGAWHASSYVVNYSYGFASRFMVGSILRLFAGSFVTEREAYWFCFAVYILLILLCSALLNRLYRSVPPDIKPAALFGIAFFVLCPGNIAAMWDSGNFGKLDVYGLICSLVGVILFCKIRRIWLRYLSLTLCACLAIAFYQGYVFLHFSILATVMIHDIAQDQDSKERRKRIIFAAVSFVCVSACFLVFQFVSTIPFSSAEEMLEELQRHTDLAMKKRPLEYEYFFPLKNSTNLVPYVINRENYRPKVLAELVLLSPLLFALMYAIIKYNRGNRKLRELLNGFNLSLLTVLFVIPQFLLNVDWGRWSTAITIDVAFVFAYWLYRGDPRLTELSKDLSGQLKSKPLPYLLLLIYTHILKLFDVMGISYSVDCLERFVFRVFDSLKALF